MVSLAGTSHLANPGGLLRIPAAEPVGHSLRGDGHGKPRRRRLSGLLLQGGRRRGGRAADRRPAQKRGVRSGPRARRAGEHSQLAAVGGSVGGTDGRGGAGRGVRLRGAVYGVVSAAERRGEEAV